MEYTSALDGFKSQTRSYRAARGGSKRMGNLKSDWDRIRCGEKVKSMNLRGCVKMTKGKSMIAIPIYYHGLRSGGLWDKSWTHCSAACCHLFWSELGRNPRDAKCFISSLDTVLLKDEATQEQYP